MKELKIVNELDLGVPVRGSYVVGDYIYILADVLYRATYSGDTIGTLEPLSSVTAPNAILSDGTYLYVGGNNEGVAGSRLFVVGIANFDLKTSVLISASSSRNRVTIPHFIDQFGYVHTSSWNVSGTSYRVYDYNSDLNNLNLITSSGPPYSRASQQLPSGNIVINQAQAANNSLYSWDGSTLTEIDFVDIETLPGNCYYTKFKNNILTIQRTLTGYCALIGDVDNKLIQISSNLLQLPQSGRTLDADGELAYMLGTDTLFVVDLVENELQIKNSMLFNNNFVASQELNQVHCGNNRVYVANGNKLYTLRWHVKAGFTVSNSNPAVGETITFSAIQ